MTNTPKPKPKRSIRLVPVDARAAAAGGVTPVAMSKAVYQRAANKIGPEGLADVESQLAASAEAADEVSRGGKDRTRAADVTTAGVRLCDSNCPFRVGGQAGCDVFQLRQREGNDITGGSCERDLLYLGKVQQILEQGDEDKIRSIAGDFTGQILIQIRMLFDRIVTDGAVVEVPRFDAKGSAIFEEVPELDRFGNEVYDPITNRLIYRKRLVKEQKEHPALNRLTLLLKETRLINMAEWQLTPKSSGTPPPTEGFIMLEEEGGTELTLDGICTKMDEQTKLLTDALSKSAADRADDPAYVAIMQKSGGGNIANRGSV